jgi:prevent-host-death family protein
MEPAYSVYDAKARLSEVLRVVKGGQSVVITERGRPVARIVRLDPENEESLDARWARLTATGRLRPPEVGRGALPPVGARSPGALSRFLRDR